jgi:2-methylcitrate dehydratase PrpD
MLGFDQQPAQTLGRVPKQWRNGADLGRLGFTAAVSQRAATLSFEDLPADVVEIARQCVLDWVAVTLAGSQEPAAQIIRDDLADQGLGAGGVTVVGSTMLAPQVAAALANGTASHALDYDDVNEAMLGHPSVPILAGLVALAEARHCSGRDLLCAFVAGYEAECRVGQAVGAAHYQRGFHATGTIGTFGGAAGCCRLLGLDADVTAGALGLAATQAAGLKSMFGTMAKPFHAGRASANGLLAARLAARGFTANPASIETDQGFSEAAGGTLDVARGLRNPHRDWFIRDNLFKYHAACFQTHSAIEGLLRLRNREAFAVEDVEAVVIHADTMQMRMCAIPEPTTGLEAKFSLRHAAALVLAGCDTGATATWSDASAGDRAMVDLRSRVEVIVDAPVGGPTPVEIYLRDGSILRAAYDASVPEQDLSLQRDRLQAKYSALTVPVIGGACADELLEMLTELDSVGDIADVLTLTRES